MMTKCTPQHTHVPLVILVWELQNLFLVLPQIKQKLYAMKFESMHMVD